MRRQIVCLALSCIVGVSFTPVIAQQDQSAGRQRSARPTRDALKPAGTSTIRGRVITADTGLPVREAEIRVLLDSPRMTKAALSDEHGRYEIGELPAGRYSVSASKNGFVTAAYGQRKPVDPPGTLVVGAGETAAADLSLWKGGVLAGRVDDEFGNPVSDVQLIALQRHFTHGKRRLSSVGSGVTTDDRGEGRLFGLSPGRYYVLAMPRNRTQTFNNKGKRTGYAATYYGGIDVKEAQPLTVGIGSTTNFIVTLPLTHLSTVSGTVVDVNGAPMAGGHVSIRPADGFNHVLARAASVDATGSFSIPGIGPGTYLLQARQPAPGVPTFFFVAKVTVTGSDVEGVRLEPVGMSRVSGRIVGDSRLLTSLRGLAIQISASPVGSEIALGPQRPAFVSHDLTFQFETWPGLGVIRVTSPTRQVPVRAVRLNGVDVTDTGIEFGNAQNVDGLEVELTDRPTELSGMLTDDSGRPSERYSMLIFSQDKERWASASGRYLTLARADQDGRFVVRSLPPGEYYAVPLDYALNREWADPEFLESSRARAAAFSLKEGEVKTLILRASRR